MENTRIKRGLTQVRELVTEGAALADAMQGHPRMFQRPVREHGARRRGQRRARCRAPRLADYTENYAALRDKVRSAMTYPTLMAVASSGILLFLLSYVVPKVTKIFEQNQADLPVMTVVLLAISGFLQEYWWAIVLAAVFARHRRALVDSFARGSRAFRRFTLAIPYVGKLLKKVALARFARTLSTLLSAGIPLLQCLDIVKHVVSNAVVARAIDEARDSIREGQGIAPPLQRSGIFPSMIVHMVAVGEKSGELEQMLGKAADAYDREVESSVVSVTSILEPIMILVGGAVTLFIVMAILLPIFELNQLVR